LAKRPSAVQIAGAAKSLRGAPKRRNAVLLHES